ncbi:hypothetical protein RF11_06098 [Thelohanellus kitauei]|uniref:Uncharacterized protein n=1 Tax=Thelohanellus kitauei TaxID=669202 RepID=A0A0C2IUH3_THEKT|nr:hypothetical protein RF11_06098 [Thelohanellus kitauei]
MGCGSGSTDSCPSRCKMFFQKVKEATLISFQALPAAPNYEHYIIQKNNLKHPFFFTGSEIREKCQTFNISQKIDRDLAKQIMDNEERLMIDTAFEYSAKLVLNDGVMIKSVTMNLEPVSMTIINAITVDSESTSKIPELVDDKIQIALVPPIKDFNFANSGAFSGSYRQQPRN